MLFLMSCNENYCGAGNLTHPLHPQPSSPISGQDQHVIPAWEQVRCGCCGCVGAVWECGCATIRSGVWCAGVKVVRAVCGVLCGCERCAGSGGRSGHGALRVRHRGHRGQRVNRTCRDVQGRAGTCGLATESASSCTRHRARVIVHASSCTRHSRGGTGIRTLIGLRTGIRTLIGL